MKEMRIILRDNAIKINNRIRTDPKFPVGFMDVVTIDKADESYRLLYTTSGKFHLHRINSEEAEIKLCKVIGRTIKDGDIPYIYTSDGSTFRYVDPDIKVNDTVKVNLITRRVVDYIPFEIGKMCYVTKGRNMGCVGVITNIEQHLNGKHVIHIKDASDRVIITKSPGVFVIGEKDASMISLPADKGVRVTDVEASIEKYGQFIEKAEINE
ncbi:40S ribosomal protein S4-C [Astathelohania contejeani]|uniref:40S ribosomal protein S4-C n=1 Tax=Astathelohania contejeani TaxID=164912 RepID=A0ABQ7HVR8_9MICR|nr:40S ribosomal protein S4-C [Thelohania contejeani]